MSSGLNTLAGTLYEDFLVHFLSRPSRSPTDKQASLIVKVETHAHIWNFSHWR